MEFLLAANPKYKGGYKEERDCKKRDAGDVADVR